MSKAEDRIFFIQRFEEKKTEPYENLTQFIEVLRSSNYLTGLQGNDALFVFQVKSEQTKSPMTMFVDFEKNRMAFDRSNDEICPKALGTIIRVYGQFDLIVR